MAKTTTTQIFQVLPDYFGSAEKCSSMERKNVNTNPRYKFFKQTHFTAGDVEQFEKYRDATNGRACVSNISLSDNRFNKFDTSHLINWKRYKKLNTTAVTNTFNYLFNKFKKGIFIKIKNGRLAVFLPFSKKNFTNEWSKQIQIDPKYGDLTGFIRYINGLEGRRFFPKNVNKFIDSWYANNCLIRYEFPISEGDSNNTNMSDMIRTLCEERDLPDMEVFINRRDFPLLKKDLTEPYEHMWNDGKMPLCSHSYKQYAPVLSMVTTDDHADIPIPTGDDWARVSRSDGKYFSRTCTRSFEITPVPWDKRKPIAIFRGGSTGCGVTVKTNKRLKLAYISVSTPKDIDGLPLLDAGITKWNLRPRKLKGEKYLQTIDIKKLKSKYGVELVPYLTPQEQARFKYVINVEGHVSAFRLSLELSSGACLIIVTSKYKLWFSSMLKPFVHYVPVKGDMSDLVEKIKWCKSHDAKCRKIARNAQVFATKYLGKDGVLDYLQKLFIDLKKETGTYFYNHKSILDLQEQKEIDLLAKLNFPKTTKNITDMVEIPCQARSYSLLHGIEWLVRYALTNGVFLEMAPPEKNELFKNRLSLITEHSFGGFACVMKTTTDTSRKREMIHETFVGTHGTNLLTKQIPNFAYIFGMFEDSNGSHMVMERIRGQTLADYIKSSDFNFQDYSLIILQLALALHVAQSTCGFVHYDLTPWNIIIQRLPTSMTFEYIIDHNTVENIVTQLVPVIIDMGRSHIIHDSNHYGLVNKFQTSTVQDILSLLITSLHEVSERSSPDTVHILTMANFLSGTNYRHKPFHPSGRNGLGDLRFFISKNKKYTELLHGIKGNLEEKTPIDLFNYIKKNLPYKFSIIKNERLGFNMSRGNERQVFDFAFAGTPDERAMTFVKVFHRVLKCELPATENKFVVYYISQMMTDNLTSVHEIMLKYLTSVDINPKKYTRKYTNAMNYLNEKYSMMMRNMEESPIEYSEAGTHKSTRSPYTVATFERPDVILALLTKIKGGFSPDLTPYKEIIERILLNDGIFKLDDETRSYYLKNFQTLLEGNSLYMKAQVAVRVSLRNTATEVYRINARAIGLQITGGEGDCSDAEEYLNVCNKIEEILKVV